MTVHPLSCVGSDVQLSPEHHGAAVVVLKAYNEGSGVGLARLVQTTPLQCVVDATIDGLPEGDYRVSVHEYGDLSRGCERLVSATEHLCTYSLIIYILNVWLS